MKRKIILIGDFLDKGKDVEKTINFIHKNLKWFHIVKGNHENYVYKRLIGEVKEDVELEKSYFTSVSLLINNEELRIKFFDIFNQSKEFFVSDRFIVTHAPCKKKYLGKTDDQSLKKQRNIRYPKKRDFSNTSDYITAVEKELSFIKEDASRTLPFHVFGHIMVKDTMFIKNKINIDTGCVDGNKLSCISFNKENFKPFLKNVPSMSGIKGELINFFAYKEVDVNLSELEPNDFKRIKWIVNNKINFISGTVSPSDKDIESGSLETIKNALDYYKNNGIKKVVMQPKYMGSRANIILNMSKVEESYTVSRNGFKVRHLDNEKLLVLYKKLYEKLHEKEIFKNAKMVMIDSELLPWFAMGKGLIEETFIAIKEGIKSEMSFLKENGFDKFYIEKTNEMVDAGVPDLINVSKKDDLKDKFGESKYRTYVNNYMFDKQYYPTEQYEKLLEIYSEQLDLFAKDGEMEFKPFSILKVIYNDDSEMLFFNGLNEEIFKTISDDEIAVIDFEDENYLLKSEEFYKKVTNNLKMEGVVIKPDKVYYKGVAPYLKVRNDNYLTLVYGFDYKLPSKYDKLLKRKSIRRKLATSISEFELGKRMLEVKYCDINQENKAFVNTACLMVLETNKEKELDPRL